MESRSAPQRRLGAEEPIQPVEDNGIFFLFFTTLKCLTSLSCWNLEVGLTLSSSNVTVNATERW